MKRFALLSLLLSSPAWAGDCRPVDLRAELGAPRDQGTSGWCYAHTAADLISQKTRTRVSAFDLALHFVASDVQDFLRIPSPEVQGYLRENPWELDLIDSVRRQSLSSLDPAVLLTSEGLLDYAGLEDGSLLAANGRGLCPDEKIAGGDEGFARDLAAIQTWIQRQIRTAAMPLSRWSEMPNEARRILGLAADWADSQCGERIPLAQPLLPDSHYAAFDLEEFEKRTTEGSLNLAQAQAELWARIDGNLDQGKISAIGYNAYDLITREAADVDDGDHSSVIAARRPAAAGGCEYFVRNAWGPSCEFYPSSRQSRCDAAAGGVWVHSEDIPSLYSVVSYR